MSERDSATKPKACPGRDALRFIQFAEEAKAKGDDVVFAAALIRAAQLIQLQKQFDAIDAALTPSTGA